ncbi:MAG: lipoate--protein ligase [Chitinophagales bacterium]|nr:lipoate--protein ligase [Chitinophagales bacterium]
METQQLNLIISTRSNPFFNLSLEKWALENLEVENTDFLLLYINEPCVVVGRNQNIFEEVDIAYCLKNNIQICRRISGGGTVFHDKGNLNWAFITKNDIKKVNNYTWAVKPLFSILKKIGLSPYLTQRNAIEIDGYKISGQAQFTNKKAIISHGTLLVNSHLEFMQKAIESPLELSIKSKASKSVRSKVKNVSELLEKSNITALELLEMFKEVGKIYPLNFNEIDSSFFQSEEWIYNRSPKFSLKYKMNNEDFILQVEKGKIVSILNKKGLPIIDSPYKNMNFLAFLTR